MRWTSDRKRIAAPRFADSLRLSIRAAWSLLQQKAEVTAEAIDDEIKQAAGLFLARLPRVGAPKHPHEEQDIAGVEVGSHAANLFAAVEQVGDGADDEEADRLERPYTPRYEFQGVSDDAELARISARIGIKPAAA